MITLATDPQATKEKSDLGGFTRQESEATSSSPPPAYTPPQSVIARPVNNLYICESQTAIKGNWIVDPNIVTPKLLMPEVPEGERLENLHLEGCYSSVKARLSLVSDTETKSYLYAGSTHGNVTIHIVSDASQGNEDRHDFLSSQDHRLNQSFHLKLVNHYASITVYIPRDFRGPVSFENQMGSTNFSEAVTQHLRHLGKQNGIGKVFIGDIKDFGEADSEPWQGDEMVIRNEYARIRVYYADEASPPSSGLKGFIGSIFGFL